MQPLTFIVTQSIRVNTRSGVNKWYVHCMFIEQDNYYENSLSMRTTSTKTEPTKRKYIYTWSEDVITLLTDPDTALLTREVS